MFDIGKQMQTISKDFVMAVTNFFGPEQCKDGAEEVN